MALTAHVDNVRTPGKLVADAGTFHVLAASTGNTASGGTAGADKTATGNSGWLDVGMIEECQAHLELGTLAGTGTLDVRIEIADDSSGNGNEVVAVFSQVDQTADDTEAKIDGISIDKRYVNCYWTISGITSAGIDVTLRTNKDHYDTARSATAG